MDKSNNKDERNTEQLILDAAMKEFSVKGFAGARTAAIAAEAGVTHAMLHYYFRTKEKLFERIFQDKLSHIINVFLSPAVTGDGSLRQRISRVIEGHIDFLMENRDLPVFFITTINARPEAYNDAFDALGAVARARLANLQTELDRAYADGEIVKTDARTLVVDIACLNVFPFLARPMLISMMGYASLEEYMEERKRENVEIIMKRLS